jgi:HEAT repeat protein
MEDAEEELVRVEAIKALLDSDMQSHAKLAYPILLRLSQDDASDDVKAAAKLAAGKLRPTDGAADVFVLTTRLGDKDWRWRVLASECLRISRPRTNDAAVAALVELVLNDREIKPRIAAAAALGAIGSPAAGPLDALTKSLKHADADLRVVAAAALGQVNAGAGSKVPAFEALRARYQDRDEEDAVRRSAGEALKKIDPAAALRLGVP